MAKVNQNKLIGALIVGIITLIVVIVIVVVAKEIFPSNDRESSKTDLGTNTNSFTTTTTTPSVTTPSQSASQTDNSSTESTSQTSQSTQSSVETKTMYVQNYVYMRTGPGTENEIIETLSKGLEVQVVKLEDEWYEIIWNGITGYVYQSYLGEAPPPVTQATVTTPTAAE